MSTFKTAIRETATVFVFSLFAGLFGYLLRVLLAKNLSVAQFGLFYSVVTLFIFMTYFIDAGLGQAVSKFIIDLRVHKQIRKVNDLIWSTLALQIGVSLILFLFAYFFSGLLSTHFFHTDATSLTRIMTFWLLTTPLYFVYTTIFTGFQKPSWSTGADALKSLLILVLSYSLLMLGLSIKAPVYAYFFANIILILGLYFLMKRLHPRFSLLKFKFDKDLAFKAMKFGIFVTFSNLIWFVITQIDTLVVTYFTDVTQVGLYQVAVPIAALLLYVTNALSIVLFPIASELSSRKEHGKLGYGLELIYKYLLIVLVPMVVFMYSFPDNIINILFRSEYLGAVSSLKILAVSAIFFSLTIINNSALTAIGKPQKVAKTMIYIALLNLILNLIFVPMYGIIGAASSTLFSFIIAAILSSYRVKKEVKFHYPVKIWVVLFILAPLLVLFVNYLRAMITLSLWPKLISIALVIGVVYAAILLLSRIITITEIKELVNAAMKKG